MADTKDKINHKTGKYKNGKCPYPICALRTNRDGLKCILKCICSLVAYTNLAKNVSLFTGITVFLFLFPSTVDLVCYRSKSHLVELLKYIVLAIDSIVLFTTFSTVFGFMDQDALTFFVNPNAMILEGLVIPKNKLFKLMLSNIPMIIVCYIGSPAFDCSLLVNIFRSDRFETRKKKEA
ncbi:hypothetical protein [Caproiciproducens sp.]|uniref:hypothetical protein n=1 Tax=Caproiciproducens sp. TaxID=1954376 RepID=UPI002899ECAE|nr:hypothetical protein [Caproiciproducens sp.]